MMVIASVDFVDLAQIPFTSWLCGLLSLISLFLLWGIGVTEGANQKEIKTLEANLDIEQRVAKSAKGEVLLANEKMSNKLKDIDSELTELIESGWFNRREIVLLRSINASIGDRELGVIANSVLGAIKKHEDGKG